jgi:hypothetical protein
MENDSQYFTTTPPETPSTIDGELTVLVDEDGEMVLDITQTLSNFAGQNEEGSLVIITTDETHSNLDNSTITYNILQENACDISLPFQNTSDFVLDDSHIPIIALQEPTTVSDLNKVIFLILDIENCYCLCKYLVFFYRIKPNCFNPTIPQIQSTMYQSRILYMFQEKGKLYLLWNHHSKEPLVKSNQLLHR